jgi:hypothetical protein
MTRRRSLLAVAVFLPILAGCGGSTAGGKRATDYPLVTQTTEHQQAVTTANGAVVRRPVKPTVYEAASSASCERTLATFHDGSRPPRRPVVIPPAPGLRARALSEREILIEWSFRDLPADCRPDSALLAIVANDDPGATPTTRRVAVADDSGSARVTYPDFLPPPDVAHASASTGEGLSSRTVSVLIRR